MATVKVSAQASYQFKTLKVIIPKEIHSEYYSEQRAKTFGKMNVCASMNHSKKGRFTEDQVRSIRREIENTPIAEVARKWNIHYNSIAAIRDGVNYSWVKD